MKTQVLKSALIGMTGLALFAGNAMAAPTTCNDPNDPVCNQGATQFEIKDMFKHSVDISYDARKPEEKTLTFELNGKEGITAADTILSAYLYLYLSDDSNHDSSESIKLNYDNTGWSTATTINWSNASGNQLSANLAAYLTTDHILTVKIGAGTGDFQLNGYDLSGCYSSPAPVPEPSTMLLFGAGLSGLAAIGRKK